MTTKDLPPLGSIRINTCMFSDLLRIPGIGNRSAHVIEDARRYFGNLTEELFLSLRLRNPGALLKYFDFSPSPGSEKPRYQNEDQYAMDDYEEYDERRGVKGDQEALGMLGHGKSFASKQIVDDDEFRRWRQKRYMSESRRSDFGKREEGMMGRKQHLSARFDRHRPFQDDYQDENGQDFMFDPPLPNMRPELYRDEDRIHYRRSYPAENNYRREQDRRANSQPMPRSISFDGKGDWQAFSIKFNMFAQGQRWTEAEMKSNLCWCLEGTASEFFSSLIRREPDLSFYNLMDRLEKRFDMKDLPETTQMYFAYASQSQRESVIEWADRVVQLAMKAFPDLTDRQIYKQAIVRFCQGCLDKEAGHYALTARPNDMEDALNKVRWFQHTNRVMYGKSRKEIKEVRYSFDSSEEEDLVLKVSKSSIKKQQENQRNSTQEKQNPGKNVTFQDPERTQHRLEKLETDTRDLKEQMSTLLNAVKDIQSSLAAKKYTRRSRSPTVGNGCYHCGEKDHFKKDCPKLKNVSLVSDEEDLNSSGSDLEA